MSPSRAVRLVPLPAVTIHALAAGDLATANRHAPVTLTPFFVDPGDARVWPLRSRQLTERPGDLQWITRVIVDSELGVAVGRAGFHGPPDRRGMVEVGYAVDPAQRRRGYARAALRELLAWAARVPEVHTVRACARPDNTASVNLILQYGFTEVGEQWDDQEGLETVFEVGA